MSAEQIRAFGQWALEHGIWVITDEIYQHLTYDGVPPFTSVLAEVPELAGTTVILGGGRQDLRDDGLAGGLDGRPPRTSSRRRRTCSRT